MMRSKSVWGAALAVLATTAIAAAGAAARPSHESLIVSAGGKPVSVGTPVDGVLEFGPCGTFEGEGALATNDAPVVSVAFTSHAGGAGGCGEGGPIIGGQIDEIELSAKGAFVVSGELVYKTTLPESCEYALLTLDGSFTIPGQTEAKVSGRGRRLKGSSQGCARKRDITGVTAKLLSVTKAALEAERSSSRGPSFGGVKSATTCIPGPTRSGGATAYRLEWAAAVDPTSPPSEITYNVYQATTPGGEDLSTPTYTTAAGATSFETPKLSEEGTFYFIVRARDKAGREDSNKVERRGEDICE